MARRTYTREDVERCYHYTHGDVYRPHVNVKVRRGLEDVDFAGDGEIPDGLTLEWIREHLSDERVDAIFWRTCEDEWEQLQQDAEEVFGAGVEVHAGGRMSGWACVHGLDCIEEWDAVALAKWRRFERYAEQITRGIPEQMVYSIAANEWEAAEAHRVERAGLHRDVAPALVDEGPIGIAAHVSMRFA